MPPSLLFGTSTLGLLDREADDPDDMICEVFETPGFTGFDTSPHYGDAETTLGEILTRDDIRKTYPRSSYHIMAKGGRWGTPHVDWSVKHVKQGLRETLHNLQTEYVDTYLLQDVEYGSSSQWKNELPDTLEYLAILRRSGILRRIGFTCHPLSTVRKLFDTIPSASLLVDTVFCYGHTTLINTLINTTTGIAASPSSLHTLYQGSNHIPSHVQLIDGAPYAMGLLQGRSNVIHSYAKPPPVVQRYGSDWSAFVQQWDQRLQARHKRTLAEVAMDYTFNCTPASKVVVGAQSVREIAMIGRAWRAVELREWEHL